MGRTLNNTPKNIASELGLLGKLRAGINLSNFLLVSGVDSEGLPFGVAPDMAEAVGKSWGCEVELVPFPSPGVLADAASEDVWDIGLIAAEPARAETIKFSAAYVEIEATYMIRRGLDLKQIDEVDQNGIKIGVAGRSAYDLYLTRTIENAGLVRGEGLGGAVELFAEGKVDVLAGLRPGLIADAARLQGNVLAGRFTTVQQAMGSCRGNEALSQELASFVEEAKTSGLVERLIKKHGMEGKLLVAKPNISAGL